MLSIASVRSAGGAANYFAKDNYYTQEESSEASSWAGEGSTDLGLSGDVGKDSFENILNGELRDGEKVGQVENRRPGLDMTFSMPKSASLMAYIGGDKRILAAHMSAVKATMSWVEKNLAEGRKEIDGRRVPVRTGNLVYALFQHDTSRALDPQGHIHAVIANLTKMPDGKWQALHNGELWKNNSVIGSIYHAFFRERIEALGYDVVPSGKHGTFEIAGVAKEVLELFSQRRAVILGKALELGIRSTEGLREITKNSRDPKLGVADREALRVGWIDKAATVGFDGKELLAAALARVTRDPGRGIMARGYEAVSDAVRSAQGIVAAFLRPNDALVDRGLVRLVQSPVDARAQLAVASAVRILSQREAAWQLNMLSKTALDLGLKGVTIGHVEARIGTLLERGALVPGKSHRHDGIVTMATTPEAIRTEEAIISEMEKGKGTVSPIVAAADAPERLQAASKVTLNAGQIAAGAMIVSSRDRIVAVQGIAGAGKSTMLQAVVEVAHAAANVARAEGHNVLGLAFQTKMVRDLQEGTGAPSRTIASFLLRHQHVLHRQEGPRYEAAREALKNTVILVDESSMVSSEQTLKLEQIANILGVEKLALIGDRQQISSIDAGKAFALVQAAGVTMARMDENLRQQGEILPVVAALADRGQSGQAIRTLGENVIEDKDHIDRAADMWLALAPDDREQTAIFASGREAREHINMRIQEGLAAEGTLGKDGLALTIFERVNLTREELRYSQNWRAGLKLDVMFRTDELGLGKGMYDVVKVHKNGKVELSDGKRQFKIDPQKLSPHATEDRLGLAEPKSIAIHEGEQIRWTANDNARALDNSALAQVVGIDAGGVTVETAAREQLVLPHGDPMLSRLDLAYSLNMHMAQGITVDKAIAVMSSFERFLSNQRLFNVAVTRVRQDLTLVVDDAKRLIEQIERTPGDKTSALETIGRIDVDGRKEQSAEMLAGMLGETVEFDPGEIPSDDLAAPIEGWSPDNPKGDKPATEGQGSDTKPGSDLRAPDPDPIDLDSLPPLPERTLGLDL